jgi:hypothetical protein
MGKQLPCGSLDVGRVAVAVLGADVDVDRSAQAVMTAATLWWVIVLLSSLTMSMLISCRMMSETT